MRGAEPSLRQPVEGGVQSQDAPPVTWVEWDLTALRSANEDGVCGPFWQTASYFDGMSRLIGLQFRGLMRRRDGRDGGPWMITEAGRAFLREVTQASHG